MFIFVMLSYLFVVVTCWERVDLLALLCDVFSCIFFTFPYGVLCQVCYLIVSIPDLSLSTYIVYNEVDVTSTTNTPNLATI